MDTHEGASQIGHKVRPATTENVFLLVPNIVGYIRIFLAIFSLYFMPIHPRTCSFLYTVSCLLDAIDGMLARRFNQSTQFGAILDMTIDRCTTSCLLVFLAVAYPQWSMLFQGLISLDFASHFMHVYATLAMGSTNQSHKKVHENRPWVMRIYYSNAKVLFTVCACNELFFITLYLLSFSTDTPINRSDRPENATLNMWIKLGNSIPFQFILSISGILMLFKQYVNVIQMVEACKWIAEGDIERRRQMSVSNRLQKMR